MLQDNRLIGLFVYRNAFFWMLCLFVGMAVVSLQGACDGRGSGIEEEPRSERGQGGSERDPHDAMDEQEPKEALAEEESVADAAPEASATEEATEETVSPERSAEAAPEAAPERLPTCIPSTSEPIDRVRAWRDDLKLGAGLLASKLEACRGEAYRIVAPAKMEITIEVQDLSFGDDLTLTVYNTRRLNGRAADPPLGQTTSLPNRYMYLQTTIGLSGEIGIVIDGFKHRREIPYKIQVYCTKNCHLSTTRFPIVLMHGFMGTDKYFNFLEYYYQVKGHLETRGYHIFTPVVQPIANSSSRVLTLKNQIDQYMQQTGARKLNLIAHSQGGVDGRLLIAEHKYGDRIASLTTISTPHRGVPVPNLFLPPSQELGEQNMADYNRRYPDDPRVSYYSWAGVTCSRLDDDCRKKYDDEVVDPLLAAFYHTLLQTRGPNDGIVTVESARWGRFLGEIPADHFDEVGQIAKTNNKPFEHKAFYLKEAQRLTQAGF